MMTRVFHPRRWLIAIALSIFVHEIVIALAGLHVTHARPQADQVIERIAIERRPTPSPKPSPSPTPAPTPKPAVTPTVPPKATPMPVVVRKENGASARAPRRAKRGGSEATHRTIVAKRSNIPAPPAHHGTGVGAAPGGIGAGAGPGNGNGGNNGTGAGAGTGNQGNGANGAFNANIICGFVDFTPKGAPHYRNGAASEVVDATVHFADGHTERARFPYPWVYQNGEHDDPWSSTNLRNENFEVLVQFPPAGFALSADDTYVKYILDHSDPRNGLTPLPPCPGDKG